MSSEAGFNLLIHVHRGPRRTAVHDSNFDFFSNKFADGKIPTLLVVTGCENEESMDCWMEANSAAYADDNSSYAQCVAACFASGGRFEELYAPLRQQSSEALQAAIGACSLETPVRIFDTDSFSSFWMRIWNGFVEWSNLGEKYRMKLNEGARDVLIRCGVSEEFVDKCTSDLKDVVSEVGDAAKQALTAALIAYVTKAIVSSDGGKPG